MRHGDNVLKRGDRWFFRCRIPQRLVAAVGRHEIVYALRTDRRDVAQYLAAAIRLRLSGWWREVEDMAGGGKLDHVIPELLRRRFKANLDTAFRQYAATLAEPDYDATLLIEAEENALDVLVEDASDRTLAPYMAPALQMLHDAGYPAVATDQQSRVLARHMMECAGLLIEARLRWARGQEDYRPKFPKLPEELFPAPRTKRQRREAEDRSDREAGVVPVADQPVPALVMNLVADWASENGTDGRRLYERNRIARTFCETIRKDDAALITADDIIRWKEKRLSAVSAKTFTNEIMCLSPIWKWAKVNRRLSFSENPFSGLAPKATRRGPAPVRPYTAIEAEIVLKAARNERKALLRWAPWLLAYTGARLGEILHAAREDVRSEQGVPCLVLHGDGEVALKTEHSRRMIPIHPDLKSEGFLVYVDSLPPGSVLFPDCKPDAFGNRAGTGTKRIGNWLRKRLEITDKRISPSHSWRHLFEDRARGIDMPLEVVDAMLGHETGGSAGRSYGEGLRGKPFKTQEWMNRMPSIVPLQGDRPSRS